MGNMETLVVSGFVAMSGLAFLMLVAGARRGVLAKAEAERSERAAPAADEKPADQPEATPAASVPD